MTDAEVQFVLPGKVERFLALLAKRYAGTSEDRLAALILAAKCTVDTGTFYDNWNGGQYGHDVVLEVPSAVFETILDKKDEVEGRIRDDLSRCQSIPDESIQAVRIELSDDADLAQWRPGSARIVADAATRPSVDAAALSRLWEPGYSRLFLSHKAEHKETAAALKQELLVRGFTCFVAHEDIEPTLEWQAEIERALHSMEALIALMDPGFSDSNWTDQEVGAAMGRGVPIVAVDLGQTPYGFIGKYQAVKGQGKTSGALAGELAGLFIANPATKHRVVEKILCRFENASGYVQANTLFHLLVTVDDPPQGFLQRIEDAFRDNVQVSEAWAVRRGLPRLRERLGAGGAGDGT